LCCTSNWPIPIESDRLNAVRAALATSRLRTVDNGEAFVDTWPVSGDGSALLAARGHACVFFDEAPGRTCRIHERLGHDALPLACRQFPRVCVTDPRGVSVTLSHYCPTAAAMLDRGGPMAIVSDAAFPDAGEYVGLDARDTLPPLLRSTVLMSWDAWWEWERLAVERIASARQPIAEVLVSLRAAVEDVGKWTPGEGDLVARLRRAFSGSTSGAVGRAPAGADLVAGVLAAIPDDLRPAQLPSGQRPSATALRNLVAAHAFASWTAHVGQGLQSWLGSLEAVVALADAGCGVREIDLLLRHLADPHLLAQEISRPG
jgi:Fe-S-cluster containining protein